MEGLAFVFTKQKQGKNHWISSEYQSRNKNM